MIDLNPFYDLILQEIIAHTPSTSYDHVTFEPSQVNMLLVSCLRLDSCLKQLRYRQRLFPLFEEHFLLRLDDHQLDSLRALVELQNLLRRKGNPKISVVLRMNHLCIAMNNGDHWHLDRQLDNPYITRNNITLSPADQEWLGSVNLDSAQERRSLEVKRVLLHKFSKVSYLSLRLINTLQTADQDVVFSSSQTLTKVRAKVRKNILSLMVATKRTLQPRKRGRIIVRGTFIKDVIRSKNMKRFKKNLFSIRLTLMDSLKVRGRQVRTFHLDKELIASQLLENLLELNLDPPFPLSFPQECRIPTNTLLIRLAIDSQNNHLLLLTLSGHQRTNSPSYTEVLKVAQIGALTPQEVNIRMLEWNFNDELPRHVPPSNQALLALLQPFLLQLPNLSNELSMQALIAESTALRSHFLSDIFLDSLRRFALLSADASSRSGNASDIPDDQHGNEPSLLDDVNSMLLLHSSHHAEQRSYSDFDTTLF